VSVDDSWGPGRGHGAWPGAFGHLLSWEGCSSPAPPWVSRVLPPCSSAASFAPCSVILAQHVSGPASPQLPHPEPTSGVPVGRYVPAVSPGTAGTRAVSLGMVLDEEEEDLFSQHPASPQLGAQAWEAPRKRGLRVIFISDLLNCPKPLCDCAISCS